MQCAPQSADAAQWHEAIHLVLCPTQARYKPVLKVAPECSPLIDQATDEDTGDVSGQVATRRAALGSGEGAGAAGIGMGADGLADASSGIHSEALSSLLRSMLTMDTMAWRGEEARSVGVRGSSRGARRRLSAEDQGDLPASLYGLVVRLAPTVTAEALLAAETDWAAALDVELLASAWREECRPVVVAPRDARTGRVLDAAAGAREASLLVFLCKQVGVSGEGCEEEEGVVEGEWGRDGTGRPGIWRCGQQVGGG